MVSKSSTSWCWQHGVWEHTDLNLNAGFAAWQLCDPSERLNLAGLQPPLQEGRASPPCQVCPEDGARCAQQKAAWHTGVPALSNSSVVRWL